MIPPQTLHPEFIDHSPHHVAFMSGLEVLGAVAAASQLLSSICNLIHLSRELQTQIKQGPDLFRHQTEDLDTLINILDHIRDKTSLQKPGIEKYIAILQCRVENLRNIISSYINRLAKRHVRRILNAFSIIESGKSIARQFEALNRDKTTLILFLSASLNENIDLLSKRITMSQESLKAQKVTTENDKILVLESYDPRKTALQDESARSPNTPNQFTAVAQPPTNRNSGSQSQSGQNESYTSANAARRETTSPPVTQSNFTWSGNSGGNQVAYVNEQRGFSFRTGPEK